MKIMPVKSLFLCIALLFATQMNATGGADTLANNEDVVRATTSRLQLMLLNPQLEHHGIEQARVRVKFRLDPEGHIQLIQIGAPESYLKRFIEKRLDGEKLQVKGLQPNTDYFVDLRFNLI